MKWVEKTQFGEEKKILHNPYAYSKVGMVNKHRKKKTKSHYNYVNLILVKNCFVHLSCPRFILDPPLLCKLAVAEA